MSKPTPLNLLPDADRINGLMLADNATGRMDDVLHLQYTNAAQGDFQISLRAGDAMYLLNLLSALQRDWGYQIAPAD